MKGRRIRIVNGGCTLKDIITLGHCRLVFAAERAGCLPDWLGSAWRGMLGHALKGAVCTTGLPECAPCRLINLCPYPAIYEARPPLEPHILRRYPQAPGPFVLRTSPGGQIQAGDRLSIDVLMFGKHVSDLPLIVRALTLGGREGIGASRIPLRLEEMWAVDADNRCRPVSLDQLDREPLGYTPDLMPAPAGSSIQIEFCSPLRLRINNEYVTSAGLRFRDFFSVLLRRYSALSALYGSGEPDLAFRELVESSESVRMRPVHLVMHDLARQSSRQRKTIPMGGIVGRAELSGSELARLWPLLWIGQWLHVGKGVNMGLGHYRLHY